MDRRDWTFTLVFIVSLLISLYFLGASITGRLVQSMYCEDGVCKEFCRFNTDCSGDEMCCDYGGFGVCEQALACAEAYQLQPEVDIENLPMLESPAPVRKGNILLYSIITLLILLIGFLYFMGRKRESKKAVYKKRSSK